jgi:hypothetical protein
MKPMAANFCSMRSSLLALVDVTKFQTTEAYSSLGITMVKYNIYGPSKVAEKVTLRTIPCENIWLEL